MRRKATFEELKDLAKAVKSYCDFCIRQNNKYDAFEIANACKETIENFANDFIISVPIYLYFWNKIDRIIVNWDKF